MTSPFAFPAPSLSKIHKPNTAGAVQGFLDRQPAAPVTANPMMPQGGIAQLYNQVYGTTTPQQVVQQRQQTPQQKVTAAAPAAQQQGLPPQQASVAESKLPGGQTGNYLNGIQSAIGQMQQQAPPPPPPPEQPPPYQPLAALPTETAGAQGTGAREREEGTAPPTEMPVTSPGEEQQTEMPPGGGEGGRDADVPLFSPEYWTGAGGAKKPWSDFGYENLKNLGGASNTEAFQAWIQHGQGWHRHVWDMLGETSGSSKPLPNPKDTNYNINYEGNDLPQEIREQITDPGLQDLVLKWDAKASRLRQLVAENDGTDLMLRQIQDITNDLRTIETSLGGYNINLRHTDDPGYGAGGEIFGDPFSGDPYDRFIAENNQINKVVKQMFPGFGSYSPQQKAAAIELAQQFVQHKGQQINQQKGLDELVRSRDEYEENPLFQGILDQVKGITGQQNYDFDAIRNQYVGDQNELLSNRMSGLGSSLGARGLPAAAGAGLAAEINRAAARDVARGLGDIGLREQESARRFALENLGVTQSGLGSTYGPLQQLNQQIAGALGAPVGQTFNPASGALDASSAILGLSIADQARDDARSDARFGRYMDIGNLVFGGGQGGSAAGGGGGGAVDSILGILGMLGVGA